MQKIIPLKKELDFKIEVEEIVSIALEHDLYIEENTLKGNFHINGEYRISDISLDTDPFEFSIPLDVDFDSKYNLKDSIVEVDNFYYKLIDDHKLSVNIDVLVDKIEEVEEVKEIKELQEVKEEKEERKTIEENCDKEDVTSLFDNMMDDDVYSSYKVYIVKESDTIESIITKYNITKEQLSSYNEITGIKMGDKLIIPSNERNM